MTKISKRPTARKRDFHIKDIKNGRIRSFHTEKEAEEFIEGFERPNDLLNIKSRASKK